MLTNAQKAALFRAIDAVPEFSGMGVGYVGDGQCTVLRDSNHPTGLSTFLILEETTESVIPAGPAPPRPQAPPPNFPLWSEVFGAGLNCMGAVLSGVAIAGEATAAPVTGGTSLALVYVTSAAAVASSAQCGVSVGRVLNAVFDPQANQILDSAAWYQVTGDVLDGISLAGSVASLGQAAQACIRLKQASGRPFREILKGMSRAERKRLAEDIAKYTGEATTRHQFIQLTRAGVIPKIFSNKAVTQALRNQLLNTVSSALGVGGSALPPNVSSTSGLVHKFIVHLMQEK